MLLMHSLYRMPSHQRTRCSPKKTKIIRCFKKESCTPNYELRVNCIHNSAFFLSYLNEIEGFSTVITNNLLDGHF